MQNVLTSLRIQIPELAAQVHRIQEENAHLHFEIERRENPARLMEIARQSEFAHLKYPNYDEVVTLHQSEPLPEKKQAKQSDLPLKSKLAFIRK